MSGGDGPDHPRLTAARGLLLEGSGVHGQGEVAVTAGFILGQWGTCSFPLALSLRTVRGHGVLCLVSERERRPKSWDSVSVAQLCGEKA